MSSFEEKEFEVIRDWYAKWSQIPKYVATVSFSAIAFLITIVKLCGLGKLGESTTLLKVSFILLSTSALCASMGIFFAYISFDLGVRVHLNETLIKFSINTPKNIKWIGFAGRCSGISTLISITLLLVGIYMLIAFSFSLF